MFTQDRHVFGRVVVVLIIIVGITELLITCEYSLNVFVHSPSGSAVPIAIPHAQPAGLSLMKKDDGSAKRLAVIAQVPVSGANGEIQLVNVSLALNTNLQPELKIQPLDWLTSGSAAAKIYSKRLSCYKESDPMSFQLQSDKVHRINNCKQRPPKALIIGCQKCGTGALEFFLQYHPDLAFTKSEETFFFDDRYDRGIPWYLSQMPFTTPQQLTVEKTARYYQYGEYAARIHKFDPQMKMIFIASDPVYRAVSDYIHQGQCLRSGFIRKYQRTYKIAETFEKSVLMSDGKLNTSNDLLGLGLYSEHLHPFLDIFPRGQFLVLDGDAFKDNVLSCLHKVEVFLNIGNFYTKDMFYFSDRNFTCIRVPFRNQCLPNTKGRTHPNIEHNVFIKLREYFKPYNLAFEDLFDVKMSWA